MAILGEVDCVVFGSPLRAVLHDDRTWTIRCEDSRATELGSSVADDVAALYHGPADGHYGSRQLTMFAERMNGSANIRPIPSERQDIVY